MPKINIAIDGPAGSGKTTIGKILAERINYHFIDSGLFYRYFAKNCWDNNLNYKEKEKVVEFCFQQTQDIIQDPTSFFQLLEKQRITLNQPEIGKLASHFATILELREMIYQIVRKIVISKGFVVGGRDITFKVLPKAEVKVFLTADLVIRAQRRYQQLKITSEGKIKLAEVEAELIERDQRDRNNILAAEKSSLRVDTSNFSLAESVEKIYNLYLKKINN